MLHISDQYRQFFKYSNPLFAYLATSMRYWGAWRSQRLSCEAIHGALEAYEDILQDDQSA